MKALLVILISLTMASSIYDEAHYADTFNFMISSQEDTEHLTCLHHSIQREGKYCFSSDVLTIPETDRTSKTAARSSLSDAPFAFFPLPYDLSHPFRAPPSVS